jgi:hypothetical protein
LALAVAVALPGVGALSAPTATAAGAAASDKTTLSKEEQQKLKDHNKLRAEINKQKYPASKADVVSHIKGVKPDDKKWVEETLADKTYNSADEVATALGWEVMPAPDKGATAAKSKAEKPSK